MQYNWPLAQNEFTWLDRLKICLFFLNPKNRWTQDKYVKKYEELAANYVGRRYAVYVSSGSAANQLISQYVKDSLVKKNEWPRRNIVLVNSVTWQTNVSVWVREGFGVKFIDVNLGDFCLDYQKLERYLIENHKSIAAVFPTSVLGFTPDVKKLKTLEQKYPEIKFALDNCENFMGEYGNFFSNEHGGLLGNICFPFTSSTSCFVAHQISNGQEGGFIFTNSEEEYQYYLLSRAHGLLRNLRPYLNRFEPENYEECIGYKSRIDSLGNPLVDRQFDFQTLSSNYRNSDISAYCGVLDFKRVYKNKKHRIKIYSLFKQSLNRNKYYLPQDRKDTLDVPFCLPIIINPKNESYGKGILIGKVKNLLDKLKIERRSFISGNMLRQIPYQKYENYKNHKNAEYLNNYALYIGLNGKITEKQIINLVSRLNSL